MKIMQFVSENWQEIVTAIGGIVIAARVIVKLTPTPKDDGILDKVLALLKNIGLHIK